MKSKVEEFLYLLAWTTDILTRPTFRKLTESYEEWAYRNGLPREVGRLERRGFIECRATESGDRVYQLSEQGRLHALGGRDPEARWMRPWDGRWRLVVFDVPRAQSDKRDKLRHYLRSRGFGYLQGSVWVTPDPLAEQRKVLTQGEVNVGSLILLEAQPCGGESDDQIVAKSWDFEDINHNYTEYMRVLEKQPIGTLRQPGMANAVRRWAAMERAAWLEAVSSDPLLPEPLLPPAYLGQSAWRRRKDALRRLGQQLRSFKG